ncbi:MAG: hypothetical protein ALECFALPRED_010275 [Alectoria fallacina]|uniref:GDP-mannose transporter n=1 Tax=Alectoria fallacina TaxID=1903189 RepID=A0A8H3J9K9_9LECA|nr:MAG: hypothetical protein ALECFALPRED_010275 [Alectoria fallacina]
MQPGRLADPEHLTLSSTDSESRTSVESTTNEKSGDEEALLKPNPSSQEDHQHTSSGSRMKLLLWMLANTLATIGIVFTNKSLFSSSMFKYAQLSFASYHFFMTGILLYILSRPRIGFFELKRGKFLEMLPLAAAMCLNVILQNFSLAYSSIPFYQICRVLLTPTVAAINFFMYQKTLPRTAVYALVPICIGVGMATYFNALSHEGDDSKKTSFLGVVFAFSGVICSSIYTIWVAVYHMKFGMNSMQLLSNQAPIGSAMLLYVIPWTDSFPVLHSVPLNGWILVLLKSGLCACVINLSQFYIINEAGAVSSTVVGHVKTVSIVTLGWIVGGNAAADGSVVGFLLAIAGIITYTTIMLKNKPV